MAFWDDIVKGAGDIANGTLKVVGDGVNATTKIVGDGVNATTKIIGDGFNTTTKVVGDIANSTSKEIGKAFNGAKEKINDRPEDMAIKVLEQVAKIPVVKVDRNQFLMDKFGKGLSRDQVNQLLLDGPVNMVDKERLDKVAKTCIMDNVLMASGASVLAGLPGGVAMAITIPADVAQYYAMSLKLAQELGYIYGFQYLWSEKDKLTEEAQDTLLLYLGIMLGVSGAAAILRAGGVAIGKQALKSIPQKALTKTMYYPILKKVLKIFGISLTKGTFAKGVSKVLPVVSGVISGGMTFATMKPMGENLQKELSKMVHYDAKQYEQDLESIRKEAEVIEE